MRRRQQRVRPRASRSYRNVVACLLALIAVSHAHAEDVPELGDAIGAYVTVQSWVQEFDVPAPDDPAAQVPIDGASGVSIIIRHRGRIVGTAGKVLAPDAPAIERDRLVRDTASRALRDVLADSVITGVRDGNNDLDRIGAQLTLELEVAGPLRALPSSTWARAGERIEPGLNGIALRRGERVSARFPGLMIARGSAKNPGRLMTGLALELELPAAELDDLRARFDVGLYRFRTLQLAQRTPNASPQLLHRGDVTVGPVTEQRIREVLDRLVDHVLGRLWTEEPPIGLRGDYDPVRDQYTPFAGAARDQALVVHALARYAALPHHHESTRTRSADAATAILALLAIVGPSEEDPLATPDACAAIALAAAAWPDLELDEATRALVDGAVAAMRDAPIDDATTPVRALRAAALAEMNDESAEAAVDELWRSVPPTRRLLLTPWIAWAEQNLAAHGRRDVRWSDLVAIAATLPPAQVTPEDDEVLAGGIRIGQRPNAQSLLPIGLLAALPEDRRPPGILTPGTRFIIQLVAEDRLLWAFQRPSRAVGGVRNAPWDSRMPLGTQAIAIAVLSDILAN